MVTTTTTASASSCGSSSSTSIFPRGPSGAAAAARTSSAAVVPSSTRSYSSKHKVKASSVAASTFFERRLRRGSSSTSTTMTATDYFSSSHSGSGNAKKEGKWRHARRSSLTVRSSSSSSSSSSSFGKCPLCGVTLPLHRLGSHASECNGGADKEEEENSRGSTDTTNDDDDYATASSSTSSSSSAGGCCSVLQGRRVVEASSIETQHPVRSELPYPMPMPLLSGTSNHGHDCTTTTRTDLSTNATGTDVPMYGGRELPPGLFLYDNFISEEEEELILRELDNTNTNSASSTGPWKRSSFNGTSYGKRWGVHCRLKDRCVTEAETPLPAFITQLLLPRLRNLAPMIIQSKSGRGSMSSTTIPQLVIPNEANAIDYRKSLGHWLQSHVDDRHLSKEPIANLSLAGDCVMTYTLIEAGSSSRSSLAAAAGQPAMKKEYRVLLRRRTLQILTGTARYRYRHGIHNHDLLSERRVSITMRESPLTTTASKAAGPRRPLMSVVPSNYSGPTARTGAGGAATPLSLSAAPWWKRRRVLNDTPSHNSMVPKAVSSSNPVPGLFVIEDFVTEEEEAMILSELEHGFAGGEVNDVVDRSLSQLPFAVGHPAWKSERHTGTHREKRYGRDSDLWSRAVRDPSYPLPTFVHTIVLPKLQCYSNVRELMAGWTPNEGNAIEYRRDRNNWLKAHVDDRRKHKELIANLSLAGDCYMTFTPASVSSSGTSATAAATVAAAPSASFSTKVLLRRRTLTLLTGKARYEYTHGIDPTDLLSDRRVSFTLRETV